MSNYDPESISIDIIEGLFEVDEVNKKRCFPLYALLKNVSQNKNLICATSTCSEPCFSFLSDSLVYGNPDPI